MSSTFINTIKGAEHLIIPSVGSRFHLRQHIKPFDKASRITIINWSEMEIYNNLTPYYFPNAMRINLLYDGNNKPSYNDAFTMMILLSSYGRNVEFGITSKYVSTYTPYIGQHIIPISYLEKRIFLHGYNYDTSRGLWLNYVRGDRGDRGELQ